MRALLLVGVLTSLLCGCGECVPSESAFKKKLEELSESAQGRSINIPKELDNYRTLSDSEKINLYKSL